MYKYLIGVLAFFIFIGAGCDLSSQTQVKTDIDAKTDLEETSEVDSKLSGETSVSSTTGTQTTAGLNLDLDINGDVLVDIGDDGEAKDIPKVEGEMEPILEVDADTLFDVKTDVIQKNDSEEKKEELKKETSGTYEDYNSSKLTLASSGKVILFFNANWCPTCVAFDTDAQATVRAIPAGVHILKVDYDNSTELKKKYGVTYQHTYVQVDAQGNMITKWSGSSTVADVVAHIK